MTLAIVHESKRQRRSENLATLIERGHFSSVFPPSPRDGRNYRGGIALNCSHPEGDGVHVVLVKLRPASSSEFIVDYSTGCGATSLLRVGRPLPAEVVPSLVMLKCGVQLRWLHWELEPSAGETFSVIYFLKPEGQNVVKIGRTSEFVNRLRGIQTGCPWRLETLLTYESVQDDERELHRRFAEDRIRPDGEWFVLSDQIKEFIRSKGTPKR